MASWHKSQEDAINSRLRAVNRAAKKNAIGEPEDRKHGGGGGWWDERGKTRERGVSSNSE